MRCWRRARDHPVAFLSKIESADANNRDINTACYIWMQRKQVGYKEGEKSYVLLQCFINVLKESSKMASDCCVREGLSFLARGYFEHMLAEQSPCATWINDMIIMSCVYGDLNDIEVVGKAFSDEVDGDGYAVETPSKKLNQVVQQLDALFEKHGGYSDGDRLDSFKCIIFFQTRSSVKKALDFLEGKWGYQDPALDRVKKVIQARKLVGKGTGEVAETLNTQRETVKMFREVGRGACNCLIATSVAEEGLDFPSCTAVIRADGVSDDVALVQSKGRVRSDGDYIIILSGEKKSDEFRNANGRNRRL